MIELHTDLLTWALREPFVIARGAPTWPREFSSLSSMLPATAVARG